MSIAALYVKAKSNRISTSNNGVEDEVLDHEYYEGESRKQPVATRAAAARAAEAGGTSGLSAGALSKPAALRRRTRPGPPAEGSATGFPFLLPFPSGRRTPAPSLTLLSVLFRAERQLDEISSHFKAKERRANSKSRRILEVKKQKSNASVEASGNAALRAPVGRKGSYCLTRGEKYKPNQHPMAVVPKPGPARPCTALGEMKSRVLLGNWSPSSVLGWVQVQGRGQGQAAPHSHRRPGCHCLSHQSSGSKCGEHTPTS